MDIPPLFLNKNVKIIKNVDSYTVICLTMESTPGVYSKIDVKEKSWYEIELCCTKFGFGSPGLWIASPYKKTLFYGNHFTKYGRGYLKRSFYTGDYNNLLVGVLVKNATNKSGFILEKLKITEVSSETIKKSPEPQIIGNMNNSNKIIDNNTNYQVQSFTQPTSIKKDNIKEAIQNVTFKEPLDYNVLFVNNVKKIKSDNKKIKKKFKTISNVSTFPVSNVSMIIKDMISFNDTPLENKNENVSIINNLEDNLDNLYNLDILENNLKEDVKEEDEEEEEDAEEEDSEEEDESELNYPTEKKLITTVKTSYDNIDININVYTNIDYGFHIYPVSLGIPKEHILTKFPNKTIDFFPYTIGTSILENYKKNIQSFYENLVKSRFILISKHEFGADTPILYEALARGCIPICLNEFDKYTSIFVPKEILNGVKKSNGIKKSNGVNIGCLEASKFSHTGFEKVSKCLIDYTKDNLTTESIAKYVLSTANKEVKNVLFLANSISGGDFLLQQSLLHGLKNILGYTNVVDYPKALTLYKNNENNENNKSIHTFNDNEIILSLPYGHLLEDSNVSRGRINKRIENTEFDIIIIMGIFTESDRKRLNIENEDYPFFSTISTNYEKNEIFFIDGNSNKENIKNRLKLYSDSGICFCKDFL
jgi:hypothetical protein